jgi:hypothetical protein
MERARLKAADKLGRLMLAGLIVLMAAGFGLLSRDLQVVSDRSAALDGQVQMYRSSPAYQTYLSLQQDLAAAQRYVLAAEKQPTYLHLNLKELSHLTPKDIRLTRFDLNPGQPADNLRIHGVVRSSDIPPEVTLAEFVERLKASSFYSNVTVERHVKRSIDNGFELSFQLVLQGVL